MTGPSGLAIAEILDKPDAAAGAESGGRDEIAITLSQQLTENMAQSPLIQLPILFFTIWSINFQRNAITQTVLLLRLVEKSSALDDEEGKIMVSD